MKIRAIKEFKASAGLNSLKIGQSKSETHLISSELGNQGGELARFHGAACQSQQIVASATSRDASIAAADLRPTAGIVKFVPVLHFGI